MFFFKKILPLLVIMLMALSPGANAKEVKLLILATKSAIGN